MTRAAAMVKSQIAPRSADWREDGDPATFVVVGCDGRSSEWMHSALVAGMALTMLVAPGP